MSKKLSIHWILAASFCLSILPLHLQAGDTKTETVASQTQIADWVKNLNNPKYKIRENATSMLIKQSDLAVPAVTKAAETDDREISGRCLRILTTIYKGKDALGTVTAREGLRTLQKSKNKTVAALANKALAKKTIEKPKNNNPRFPGGGGGVIIRRINKVIGNGETIETQEKNGKRTTKVTTTDKKIVITDDAKKKDDAEITVVVTKTDPQTKKTSTKTDKGKNLADLNKKAPEAAGYYAKYAGKHSKAVPKFPRIVGMPRIRINGKSVGGEKDTEDAEDRIAKATKRLEAATEKLTKLATSKTTTSRDLKRVAAEMQLAQEELAEAKKDLDADE